MKYVDKIYGSFELSGIIEDLINTVVFQRLKRIHQGGAIFLINPEINHTRYDHSIGVMLLIKQLGGSIEEQIAGLIHDISHTAFSHLIDYVLDSEEEDYHEKRFELVLADEELIQVIEKYGYRPNDYLDLEQFPILESPLPYLSSDRIDYTLRDLFQIDQISKQEITSFLDDLQIFENRIVLKSKKHAQWFKSQYDYLVSDYFGSKENIAVNITMKRIIKDCLEKGIIDESDFHHDDFYLIAKINKSINLTAQIKEIRAQGMNIETLRSKKRWIDPEILVENKVIKLSEWNIDSLGRN